MAVALLACSAAAVASCGGGQVHVKAMVAEGRWADACHAVYPTELSTEETDMSMLEFDDLVIARAKARIEVQVAPRLIAEQMLGGDMRFRRSPQEAQDLPTKDDAISAASRRLMKDHAILLWHVASEDPFHATLTMPKLTLRGVGGSWGSPLADEKALLRELGFSMDPSQCDNSLSTIGSRLVDKLTTTPAMELTCSSTTGRAPTAEEQAFVSSFGPGLVRKPCAPGAAACTQLAMIHPWDPLNHRVDELDLEVSFPVEAGCSITRKLALPLPPADVERSADSVRALFSSGPRPVAELLAIKNDPPAAAPEPASSPACKGVECTGRGRCVAALGSCYIGGDADCRASELCKVEGWCSAIPGTTPVDKAFRETVCAAKTDADCASSDACRLAGQCSAAPDGRCVAATSAHCASSEACTRFGLCSLAGHACRAQSDADCQRSSLCKDWKSCHAEAGACR